MNFRIFSKNTAKWIVLVLFASASVELTEQIIKTVDEFYYAGYPVVRQTAKSTSQNRKYYNQTPLIH